MGDVFKAVFEAGGWLGVLAALALFAAWHKEKQVQRLQARRIKEAKETALLLRELIPRASGRKPIVSVHDDDDEVSSIIDVKDKLQEQAREITIPSDVKELIERYNRGEGE